MKDGFAELRSLMLSNRERADSADPQNGVFVFRIRPNDYVRGSLRLPIDDEVSFFRAPREGG
jgi:hypothetical protein